MDSRGTAPAGSAGGKRRAVKPARVERVAPEPVAAPLRPEPTVEVPAVYPGLAARTDLSVESPVVATPASAAAPPQVSVVPPSPQNMRGSSGNSPARRRATPVRPERGRTSGRKRLFPGLPSAPTAVGAAALALAAAGAVTVSSSGLSAQLASGDITKFSSQASVLNGASSIGSSDALSGRKRAVSRDSEREAQQTAANQQLQAAAEAQAKARNEALAALAASAERHATYIAKNAWQLPIPMGVYHLTSRFGECSVLWSHCHTGLDFAAAPGTPIHAVAGGTVTLTGWGGAYGNRTEITLDDGTQLWYCHQTSITVSMGQRVEAGQLIGTVGATGNVTGPHLHLEVRPGGGDPVDPYAALVAHGVNPG
ncbi:MAG: peptidoglycan DD-metalloendopeptidase family protein [Nocardioides sp.]